MNQEVKINITRVEMTSDVAQIMKRAFDGDDELIIKDVQRGRSRLWKYESENECGYFITRIDFGSEMCIVAGESVCGIWLFEKIMPAIREMAKFFECKTIRFHTKRRGFERYSKKLGFTYQETIYSQALYG